MRFGTISAQANIGTGFWREKWSHGTPQSCIKRSVQFWFCKNSTWASDGILTTKKPGSFFEVMDWVDDVDAVDGGVVLAKWKSRVTDDDGNRICLRCPSIRPMWALMPHGALVCIECAAWYRKNVSWPHARVRSVQLDSWNDEQRAEVTGNALLIRWCAAFGLERPWTQIDFQNKNTQLFVEWKRCGFRLPAAEKAAVLALLRAKEVTEDTRELVFESFVDDPNVFVDVLPNRIRRILLVCLLCFGRFVRLDKHLRWRLARDIVTVQKSRE